MTYWNLITSLDTTTLFIVGAIVLGLALWIAWKVFSFFQGGEEDLPMPSTRDIIEENARFLFG